MTLTSDANITGNYIRECFDYNPVTGLTEWLIRPRNHFKTDRGYNIFNSTFPGKEVGYKSSDGYRNIEVNKVAFRLHVLIWLWMTDEWPEIIDHENGIRDDNRWFNLKNIDQLRNAQNAKRRKDNTSGVTGVGWLERLQKYQVNIYVNKKSHYLGVYADFDEAVAVRKAAEIEHKFHPNHGREDPQSEIFGE